ncbi:MAG: Unknown protein [uncultured Sulfurovum sp.]|uniref:Uncharacterized protein n=1 Tax=uncultured Sulfurovum sp. TaxID=269237 RepID=A0A6S6RRE8_9BACT|nr:MAG: Unknown protein [uncultured Sulfurovum sp.]
MKKYLIIILIAFHLMGSSLYATKTFLEKSHVHRHHHAHNGSVHQHQHSHSQTNIHYADFFTSTPDVHFFNLLNPRQIYLETITWIPNPTSESLFRPPIL